MKKPLLYFVLGAAVALVIGAALPQFAVQTGQNGVVDYPVNFWPTVANADTGFSNAVNQVIDIPSTNVIESTAYYPAQPSTVQLLPGPPGSRVEVIQTNASFTISSFVPWPGATFSSAQLNVSNSGSSSITVTITADYSPYNPSTTASVTILGGALGYVYADEVAGSSTNLSDSP